MVIGRDTISVHMINSYIQFPATGGGGGGGGGGGAPANPTLNQIYFSGIQSLSGEESGGGAFLHIWANCQFVQFNPPISNRSYGTPVVLSGSLSQQTVTAVSTQELKSAYTLAASDLITFLNTAQTGQTSPYTGANQQLQMFMNISMYLQAPNGLSQINYYELVSGNTNWGGINIFGGFGAITTPNFPQQDSTAFGHLYPSETNANFNPSTGNSGDWGICGNSGVLALNFLNPNPILPVQLMDMRARLGGNPAAGEVLTLRYKADADNGSGATEVCFHTVEITLT